LIYGKIIRRENVLFSAAKKRWKWKNEREWEGIWQVITKILLMDSPINISGGYILSVILSVILILIFFTRNNKKIFVQVFFIMKNFHRWISMKTTTLYFIDKYHYNLLIIFFLLMFLLVFYNFLVVILVRSIETTVMSLRRWMNTGLYIYI